MFVPNVLPAQLHLFECPWNQYCLSSSLVIWTRTKINWEGKVPPLRNISGGGGGITLKMHWNRCHLFIPKSGFSVIFTMYIKLRLYHQNIKSNYSCNLSTIESPFLGFWNWFTKARTTACCPTYRCMNR